MISRLVAHFDDSNLASLLELNAKEPDTIEYLYPKFVSNIDFETEEKYKDYEIQLVCDVIEKRYDDFAADAKELCNIYGPEFTKYFSLFMVFNHKLMGLEDKEIFNDRYDQGISGSFVSVVNKLLMVNDFYRVCDVVEEMDHDSMAYILLHEQCLCAVELIKENELTEKRNMVANSIDAYATIEALPLNVSGSYDRELLTNVEPLNKEFETLENVNYYDLYQRAYANKDYFNALRYILLFKDKISEAVMAKDIQYLIEELMIKIFNSMKHDTVLEELEDRIFLCSD